MLAAGALVFNLVQLVLRLIDTQWGPAFLSFAWSVLFGYVLVESLRFRAQQEAAPDGPPGPGD